MSKPMSFKAAVRSAVKLKILVDGPSGSGKTIGALSLAEGIATDGRIALIDSEHERASFYADRINFDTLPLDSHHPDRYIEAIDAAVEAGYSVVVVDSLSHAWHDVLARKEQYERDNPKANSFTTWGRFTPQWERLIQHILKVPVHVIATARSKQAYEQTEQNGKKAVVKLGMSPQVREGTEYEFGLVLSLEQSHRAIATKDNTFLFGDKDAMLNLCDGSIPNALKGWLSTAKPVAAPDAETVSAINEAISQLPDAKQQQYRARWAQKRLAGCSEDEAQVVLSHILAAIETPAGVAV